MAQDNDTQLTTAKAVSVPMDTMSERYSRGRKPASTATTAQVMPVFISGVWVRG